jgi:hypothetical protein
MSLCSHLVEQRYPIRVDLVLDDHLGFTEALIRCTVCDRPLLLEMIDWAGDLRLFRAAEPDEQATRLLLRDLSRGSCDINRAGEEVRQFSLMATPLEELLLIDDATRSIVARPSLSDLGGDAPRAGTGWRELPCDGHLIGRVQAARL